MNREPIILVDDQFQTYSPEQIEQWLGELPEWRHRLAVAYKHDAGLRQSLIAYRLLCQCLRENYGITELPTFHYGKHGKPYLSDALIAMDRPTFSQDAKDELFFSLSHCREAVCCTVAPRPVGVDIETVGRKITDSLINYCMNDKEIEAIEMSDDKQRTFLHLWTKKEAVAKLLGTGIRDDFKNLLSSDRYRTETRESERWVMSIATYNLVQ